MPWKGITRGYPFCGPFQSYFTVIAVAPFTLGEAVGRNLVHALEVANLSVFLAFFNLERECCAGAPGDTGNHAQKACGQVNAAQCACNYTNGGRDPCSADSHKQVWMGGCTLKYCKTV